MEVYIFDQFLKIISFDLNLPSLGHIYEVKIPYSIDWNYINSYFMGLSKCIKVSVLSDD